MENNNGKESSSANNSIISTSTDATSVKNNNQKAKTDWLTYEKNFYKHKLQLVEIKKMLRDADTENINKDEKIVNELYDKVFQSLNSEYTGYKKEQEEKNKSWWQSVKDAFNRGKTEGHGGVKGFFKGCWEATKTGWSKAPTWAKVGVGAGLIAGSALCMPMHTYTLVPGGHGIFTGTSFSLKTIPLLLSQPSSWILPQNILPLTMICGGANIAGRELGMAGKEYVDKIRTKLNMTEEEKEWHKIIHNENGTAIDKKRAFLLFLISTLNKPLQQQRLSYDDAGECFDAIKKAEDKEREKNDNINLSKNEISQSNSLTLENNIEKENIYENKDNINTGKSNITAENNYNINNKKEINNTNNFSKNDLNEEEKKSKNKYSANINN